MEVQMSCVFLSFLLVNPLCKNIVTVRIYIFLSVFTVVSQSIIESIFNKPVVLFVHAVCAMVAELSASFISFTVISFYFQIGHHLFLCYIFPLYL